MEKFKKGVSGLYERMSRPRGYRRIAGFNEHPVKQLSRRISRYQRLVSDLAIEINKLGFSIGEGQGVRLQMFSSLNALKKRTTNRLHAAEHYRTQKAIPLNQWTEASITSKGV